uniref:Prefoldin subunit 2 n=1 Tax=Chlamydomonas euryale TaxID=1486919 RepID=A0A7R9YQY9_9CHLO|mmetsp:Transcript_13287/g.38621  ORF Transcript_13287/g.38621 Transcript_13287/m.38621 type:complete len:123 (+) Transcript_13287:237-605(+)
MATDRRAEQVIVNEFQERRQALSEMASKINELRAEVAEHEMVLSALQPMDPTRKCFRLIDTVLVERTVAEVRPAVEKNREHLTAAVETLMAQASQREKDLQEFQAKYKIRVVSREESDAMAA